MAEQDFRSRLWLEVTRGFRFQRATGWSRGATAFARPSILVVLLVTLVPLGVILLESVPHASVNTITVNNLTDPATTSSNGFCTLREAINNANAKADTTGGDCVAGTGTDTIVFSVSGTITLGSKGTLPPILNTLTIDGSGQTITIDGASLYRVLMVNRGATLTLNDLTIAHGNSPGPFVGLDGIGGGVYNHGTLNVTSSTFSGNTAAWGGGIFSVDGTLNVTNSTFTGNSAAEDGGGVYCEGTLNVTNSTFSDNTAAYGGGLWGSGPISNSTFSGNSAQYWGGAIYSINTIFSEKSSANGGAIYGSNLSISNSTFSGNSATGIGGGVFSQGGNVINSTFYGNSAANGGGIYNDYFTLNLTNNTFRKNTASSSGGGIYNDGTLTLSNSILSNSSGENCAGGAAPFVIVNGGYNISDDATCGFGTSSGANGDTIGDNVSDSNIALDPNGLENNGGPTETIALESGSYAIDAIPVADCPPTDQRGAPRPAPGQNACDIGAFEYGSLVPSSPAPTVTLLPPALDFGTVKLGQSLAAQFVTLSNGTRKKLTISGFSIGIDYQVVSTTCPATLGVLNTGQSCDYFISFEPQGVGTKNEVFKIFDSAANSPQKVKLHGVATRR